MSLRTNLCINPAFATDITGWTKFPAGTWQAAGGRGVLTLSANTAANTLVMYDTSTPYALGTQKSMRVTLAHSRATSTQFRIALWPYSANGSGINPVVYSATVAVPAGASADLVINGGVLTNSLTVYYRLILFAVSALANGDVVYVDNVLIETSATAGAYFDGNTADGVGVSYEWVGAPYLSQSVRISNQPAALVNVSNDILPATRTVKVTTTTTTYSEVGDNWVAGAPVVVVTLRPATDAEVPPAGPATTLQSGLVDTLTLGLPTMRVIGYPATLDGVTGPTVMTWCTDLERMPEAPNAAYKATYTVQVLSPHQDPERAEDDLTDALLAVMDLLWVSDYATTTAQRTVVDNTVHSWTLTITGSLTITPEA